MRARRFRFWILWLLPMLIGRLCVPEGFMVSVASGAPRMAMCPAYAALPTMGGAAMAHVHAGAEHQAHAGHGDDGNSSGAGAPHRHRAESQCLFAFLAKSPLAAVAAIPGDFQAFADDLTRSETAPAWAAPAVLSDRIRGPPAV